MDQRIVAAHGMQQQDRAVKQRTWAYELDQYPYGWKPAEAAFSHLGTHDEQLVERRGMMQRAQHHVDTVHLSQVQGAQLRQCAKCRRQFVEGDGALITEPIPDWALVGDLDIAEH
jgi:hypothetical protein